MVEGGDGARFALEPAAELLVGCLDGDLAAEARVEGLEDVAHSAFADTADDLIGADLGTRGPRIKKKTGGQVEDGLVHGP